MSEAPIVRQKFYVIPGFVHQDILANRLLWLDSFMIAVIYGLSAKTGYCTARNKWFQKYFCQSRPNISRSLKRLEDFLYIRVENPGSSNRRIHPTDWFKTMYNGMKTDDMDPDLERKKYLKSMLSKDPNLIKSEHLPDQNLSTINNNINNTFFLSEKKKDSASPSKIIYELEPEKLLKWWDCLERVQKSFGNKLPTKPVQSFDLVLDGLSRSIKVTKIVYNIISYLDRIKDYGVTSLYAEYGIPRGSSGRGSVDRVQTLVNKVFDIRDRVLENDIWPGRTGWQVSAKSADEFFYSEWNRGGKTKRSAFTWFVVNLERVSLEEQQDTVSKTEYLAGAPVVLVDAIADLFDYRGVQYTEESLQSLAINVDRLMSQVDDRKLIAQSKDGFSQAIDFVGRPGLINRWVEFFENWNELSHGILKSQKTWRSFVDYANSTFGIDLLSETQLGKTAWENYQAGNTVDDRLSQRYDT